MIHDFDSPFDPLTTEEDIYYCFRLILGRRPHKEEWPGHSSRVGQRLRDVVATYVNSLKFANRGMFRPSSKDIVELQLHEFLIYVQAGDFGVGMQLMRQRDYEVNVSRVFRQILKPGMHVLDIGANIGFYTLLAASRVGAGGIVWAVEPNPANMRLLIASKARNGFTNVRTIQAAAAKSWDTLALFEDQSNGAVAPIRTNRPEMIRQTVMAVPMSSVVGQERVDVVKIDVEGFGGIAIQGMLELIDRCQPKIFTQFTPAALPGMSGMTGEEYLKILGDRGYGFHVLSTQGVIPCGTDGGRVMKEFRATGLAHIDLLCEV